MSPPQQSPSPSRQSALLLPHEALPAPGRVSVPALARHSIGAVAVFAFEAVEGSRQVGHLGRWITEEVASHLTELRRFNVERRSLYRDDRRVVAQVLRVRAMQPHPLATEAAVVLATPARSRAVALRFEVIRMRWQASAITVL